jgi:3-isopropylmalate/(R)-2-methylmalate dehydratase small subunit
MPVLECETLWEDAQQGDVIEVDMDEGTILHQRTGKTHKTSQYPEFLKEIIAAGGLVPYTRKKLEARA